MSIAERFAAKYKVNESTGCWEWTAWISDNGYGKLGITTGLNEYAHRISYRLYKGPIPDGLVIDHLCRVRHCVNPEHIEAVPQRVNVHRGVGPSAQAALKTECPQGHPYNELNTYHVPSSGKRQCRTCRRQRNKEFRTRSRARARAAKLGVAA